MEINELNRQIQVKIHQYCNKFNEGFSKPEYKFIRQMLFGILKSGSVQLGSATWAETKHWLPRKWPDSYQK